MNLKQPPRITAVECLKGYCLLVTFTDGFVGSIDLGPMLSGYYFEPLREPVLFRQVAISHGTLVWPNEADVCPDVLRYYCELGRVCSDADLNAHFCPPTQSSALILNDKSNL